MGGVFWEGEVRYSGGGGGEGDVEEWGYVGVGRGVGDCEDYGCWWCVGDVNFFFFLSFFCSNDVCGWDMAGYERDSASSS